jgi:hypothetical protein
MLQTETSFPELPPVTESPALPSALPKLSCAAVGFFLLAVVVFASIILAGQMIAWTAEQFAILSASMGGAAWTGEIWFVIQAAGVILLAAIYFFLSHNPLRDVYRGWLMAALVGLPGLVLRFVDPNLDQIGAIIQIVLLLLPGLVIVFLRRKTLTFNGRTALNALALAPWVMWPFLIAGAAGSPADLLLALLAGLSLGLLAASLAASSGNFWLDGLGLGTLLLILGTSFGYDGSQLLLMIVLPSFGFVAAALMPSLPGMALGIGLAAAIPLSFVDPTELAIALGDLWNWAMMASVGAMTLALLAGLLWGAWRLWKNRPRTPIIPLALLVVGWSGSLVAYLVAGQPGFYGDRLFVILKDQADVSQAVGMPDRNQRLAYVYETLTAHANTTQSGLRARLDTFHIGYQPYYLVNALEVDGGTLTRLLLAFSPEVDRVIASPHLRPLPVAGAMAVGSAAEPLEKIGWNIQMIGADRVWHEFGVTGEGIVVGQSDTGGESTHPALSDSYRGATDGNDYNWFDPWTNTSAPFDAIGHGTHTLGTILGQGGIGVAPGAQWFACVNLGRNLGNPAFYLDCMQFMLAPFPQGGDPFTDGDPTRAAHVMNNSWGCPPIEGCDPNALKAGAEALRAAGIFVVVSVGNDGPNCETANFPLALYDSVFSVGAVNRWGDMADFSSRGPVTADGSERVKPDISAPGVDIFSSYPGGKYESASGTSMAGPHLVGVVALMWSANPALIGDIDRTEQILIDTAQPYRGSTDLGCFTGGSSPNNAYGFGVVDAYAAVKAALGK